MKKTLYLHIGMPKTGTTSIQNYLYTKRDCLLNEGVIYPKPVLDKLHNVETLLFLKEYDSQASFVWSKRVTEKAVSSGQGALYEIIAEIEEQSTKLSNEDIKVVLSSESMFASFDSPEKMQVFLRLFPDYEIKVIIYLRRIDEYIHSVAMQGSKNQYPLTRNYLNNQIKNNVALHQNLPKILESWESVLGKGCIILKPFERDRLYKSNAVADFMRIISSDLSIDEKYLEDRNTSLSIETTIFWSNHLSYPVWKRSRKERIIMDILLNSDRLRARSQFKYSLLSPECRLDLIKKLEKTYEKLAESYLSSDEKKLFMQSLPKIDEDWKNWEEFDLGIDQSEYIYEEIIDGLFNRIVAIEHVNT